MLPLLPLLLLLSDLGFASACERYDRGETVTLTPLWTGTATADLLRNMFGAGGCDRDGRLPCVGEGRI